MVNSKYKNFLIDNSYPIFLFIFFLVYFSLWLSLNLDTSLINNNDLATAIKIYNYKPFISLLLDRIVFHSSIKFFLGYSFFPALVSVILFLIFKKILANNLWALSLTILSMIATENYPFIKFLTSLLNDFEIKNSVNLFENFEIMGFPIPSFSIFCFCLIFYLSINNHKFSRNKVYLITSLWLLMPHIHPVDGVIGNIYWIILIIVLIYQKRIQIKKVDFIILSILFIINNLILLNQLNFEILELTNSQSISKYNLLFYFILPVILMSMCFLLLKIDLYEFTQKFLNIYLIMLIEITLIFFSINGFGFDLQMLENRITMFLLHYLYYVPIIYYLSKDEIFYNNSTNKQTYSGKIVIILFYIFNKYKSIYLTSFIFLMISYLFLSIKL